MRIKAAYTKILTESQSLFGFAASLNKPHESKKISPVTDPEFVKIEKQLADFWKKWSFDARPNVEEAERRELVDHIEKLFAKNGPKRK